MHALLIAAVLAIDPEAVAAVSVVTYPSAESAATALATIETGTLLFSEGDCLAVKAFTRSPFTHVAGIVRDGDDVWVYDSQNGVGVRKQPLVEYLAATRPDGIRLLRPVKPFDDATSRGFRGHLEAELGRPYAVAHHLTGNRCDGLHCAEYLTDALAAAEVARADRPPKVSPASLRSGLLRHDLYVEGGAIAVLVPEPERPPGRCWCEEMWLDTQDCCAGCWSRFRGCVLCR